MTDSLWYNNTYVKHYAAMWCTAARPRWFCDEWATPIDMNTPLVAPIVSKVNKRLKKSIWNVPFIHVFRVCVLVAQSLMLHTRYTLYSWLHLSNSLQSITSEIKCRVGSNMHVQEKPKVAMILKKGIVQRLIISFLNDDDATIPQSTRLKSWWSSVELVSHWLLLCAHRLHPISLIYFFRCFFVVVFLQRHKTKKKNTIFVYVWLKFPCF